MKVLPSTRWPVRIGACAAGLFCVFCSANEVPPSPPQVLTMGGVSYQAAPMTDPRGGEAFRGSNFIHPLRTPSGFVVTDSQPSDHLHHFGLWWPWKYVEVGGRKVLCWELQQGDGLIEAREARADEDGKGFTAHSVYLDRKAEGGPREILKETTKVRISDPVDAPARGYHLDLEIAHTPVGDEPMIISAYRYSGLGFRGAAGWKNDTSTLLTSEGKQRDDSNGTQARWIRVEGQAEGDATAGVLIMSHPGNHAHPQWLRTWNSKTHDGAIFINFNPVQKTSWTFEPGQTYTRTYRVFVYDGTLSADQAEVLWRAWTEQP